MTAQLGDLFYLLTHSIADRHFWSVSLDFKAEVGKKKEIHYGEKNIAVKYCTIENFDSAVRYPA